MYQQYQGNDDFRTGNASALCCAAITALPAENAACCLAGNNQPQAYFDGRRSYFNPLRKRSHSLSGCLAIQSGGHPRRSLPLQMDLIPGPRRQRCSFPSPPAWNHPLPRRQPDNLDLPKRRRAAGSLPFRLLIRSSNSLDNSSSAQRRKKADLPPRTRHAVSRRHRRALNFHAMVVAATQQCMSTTSCGRPIMGNSC